jgi:hypothetical protein
MTNNIEISRELAKQLTSLDSNIRNTATYVLRGLISEHPQENWSDGLRARMDALLAAPAVERQEPAFYAQYGHSEYSEDWRGVIKKQFDQRNGYTAPLYTSPPAPVAVVHFVCDRIPDQTGCTFIECEDATGSSIDAGKWEVRPDGLAQLVVSRAPINLPEYKRPPPGCVITQEMAAHNACLDKVKEMNQCS